MQMPKFIIKWQRNRAVDTVTKLTAQIIDLRQQRAELNTDWEHLQVDASYLDDRIESLQRRIDKSLTLLRSTPAY